jgi:hypothetical protein
VAALKAKNKKKDHYKAHDYNERQSTVQGL